VSSRDISIFSFRGISVRLHWTFLVFLVWLAITNPGNLTDKASEIIFVLSVFFCVVLHEYGHALTARYFGIRTRDITLYPIGGIALLEKEPEPKEEFFIAIAGPLVNVFIALSISNFIDTDVEKLVSPESSYLSRIFLANSILVLFNMIPAYPMDGGRVLRSALGVTLSKATATIVSGRIGQIFSLLMAALAIYLDHVILLIISIFIFLQARREIQYWKARQEIADILTAKVE
jgi:Zn-dependent protease